MSLLSDQTRIFRGRRARQETISLVGGGELETANVNQEVPSEPAGVEAPDLGPDREAPPREVPAVEPAEAVAVPDPVPDPIPSRRRG